MKVLGNRIPNTIRLHERTHAHLHTQQPTRSFALKGVDQHTISPQPHITGKKKRGTSAPRFALCPQITGIEDLQRVRCEKAPDKAVRSMKREQRRQTETECMKDEQTGLVHML